MNTEGEGRPPAPAGWYPVDGGGQRYWDGQRWTEHTAPAGVGVPSVSGPMSASDENTWAVAAHLSGLLLAFTGVFGFIGPLIVMLVKGKESPFVDRHAKEALNFQCTILAAIVVPFLLLGLMALAMAFIGLQVVFSVFVLVAVLFVIFLAIWAFVMPIVAAVAVSKRDQYRYPLTLRIVK